MIKDFSVVLIIERHRCEEVFQNRSRLFNPLTPQARASE